MYELEKNEWKVSGTVFYLKEMQGEFACSIRISGVAKRPDLFSSSKLELPCLMTPEVYDEAKRKGLKTRMSVTLSGHLESWCNRSSSNPKVYFIADKIENIGGF